MPNARHRSSTHAQTELLIIDQPLDRLGNRGYVLRWATPENLESGHTVNDQILRPPPVCDNHRFPCSHRLQIDMTKRFTKRRKHAEQGLAHEPMVLFTRNSTQKLNSLTKPKSRDQGR